MKLDSMRVVFGLLVALLIPIEQAHCGFIQARTETVMGVPEKQADGNDHCCPERSSASKPTVPEDPICCSESMQLPPVTAPVTIVLAAPSNVMLLADLADLALPPAAPAAAGTVVPEDRSGAPPGPATAPQAPRSPPRSA